jgi:hypothetical protein
VLNNGVDGPDPATEAQGIRFGTFADHTDIRPTMLALLGLSDDYQHDGRVITEILDNHVLPSSLNGRLHSLSLLGGTFKQINAPVGLLGLDTLKISTSALESQSLNDTTFTSLESQLSNIGTARDTLASQLQPLLDWTEPSAAGPDGASKTSLLPPTAEALLDQGTALTAGVHSLASSL